MGADVSDRNVLRLQQDTQSIIWLYRHLIELRKTEPALTAGAYQAMRSRDDVLMFKRSYEGTRLLIALNFSASPRRFSFEGHAHLLISTHLDRGPGPSSCPWILRENEGVVLRLMG